MTDLGASFTDFYVSDRIGQVGIDHVVTVDRHADGIDVTTLPDTA